MRTFSILIALILFINTNVSSKEIILKCRFIINEQFTENGKKFSEESLFNENIFKLNKKKKKIEQYSESLDRYSPIKSQYKYNFENKWTEQFIIWSYDYDLDSDGKGDASFKHRIDRTTGEYNTTVLIEKSSLYFYETGVFKEINKHKCDVVKKKF